MLLVLVTVLLVSWNRFDLRIQYASYTNDSPGLEGLRANAILILDHMVTCIHYVIHKLA